MAFNDPSTHSLTQESDIQRKVISTRMVSTPAFRSAHQVNGGPR